MQPIGLRFSGSGKQGGGRNHESCDFDRHGLPAGEPCSEVGHGGADVPPVVLPGQGQGRQGDVWRHRRDGFDRLAQAWDGQLQNKDKVIVTGHITQGKWEKDGKKYYKHRLIADDIGKQLDLFADSKPNGQYVPDEDVPF